VQDAKRKFQEIVFSLTSPLSTDVALVDDRCIPCGGYG